MNVHDPRIIHWRQGEKVQNFGDYLTVLLSKELFLFPRVEADVYRIVGSCIAEWMMWQELTDLGRQDYGRIAYWGCGMRDESPIPPGLLERCRFFGVRGPLTRDALGLPKDTPLADPGLLAPLFHMPRPHAATQSKILCMPHINDDKSDKDLLSISGAESIIRPSIDNDEEELCLLLDKIASANFLLTGSLHGAVLACAYDVPFAFWDNGYVDLTFKWRDFAASVNIATIFVKDVKEGIEAYNRLIAPKLRRPPFMPLLDVCPFEIRPSVRLRAFLHDNPGKSLGFEDAVAFFEKSACENAGTRSLVLQDNLSHRIDAVTWSSKQALALEEALAEERRRRLAVEERADQLPALETQLASVTAEHAALCTRASALEDECRTLRAERDVLDRELAELRQVEEGGRSRIDELEVRLVSLKAEHAALCDRASELEDESWIRQTERDALDRELTALKGMEQDGRCHIDDLEARLASLTAERAALCTRASELEDQVQARQTERDAFDRELAELRRLERNSRFRVADLEARLTSMMTERLPLLARISELEDGIMARRAERDALAGQLVELSQQLANANSQEA